MRNSLHNFKKENKQICVGWLLQESPNTFINGFSQNLAEYYYVSLDIFGIKQYIGNSIDDLQKQSTDYKQILMILCMFQGPSFTSCSKESYVVYDTFLTFFCHIFFLITRI